MQKFDIPAEAKVRVRKQEFAVGGIHDWPKVSIEKVFAYGLQQLFNDAAASAEDDNEAIALANKRLDNLRQGILRAAPNRESDPVKAEAMRISVAQVESAIRASGRKLKDVGASAIRDLAKENLAKNETAIMAAATAAVEAAKSLSVTVDLGALDESDD